MSSFQAELKLIKKINSNSDNMQYLGFLKAWLKARISHFIWMKDIGRGAKRGYLQLVTS